MSPSSATSPTAAATASPAASKATGTNEPPPACPGGKDYKPRTGTAYLHTVSSAEAPRRSALGQVLGRQRIGRSPSTICREVARNRTTKGVYRAVSAQAAAEERARRPKTAKLAADPVLRELVQDWLERKRSPRQIAARLAAEFPADPRMRVSHETIYQSIYVQGRGALRRELAACLRTGRALRRPRRAPGAASGAGRIKDMVMISDGRPRSRTGRCPGTGKGT